MISKEHEIKFETTPTLFPGGVKGSLMLKAANLNSDYLERTTYLSVNINDTSYSLRAEPFTKCCGLRIICNENLGFCTSEKLETLLPHLKQAIRLLIFKDYQHNFPGRYLFAFPGRRVGANWQASYQFPLYKFCEEFTKPDEELSYNPVMGSYIKMFSLNLVPQGGANRQHHRNAHKLPFFKELAEQLLADKVML